MRGYSILAAIFISAVLVMLSFACAPNSSVQGVAQYAAPSGTRRHLYQKDGRLLQQCLAKCLTAEMNAVDLNMSELSRNGSPSLVALSNLARIFFTLGELEQTDASMEYFEKGRHFAEILCREYPLQVDGHYWLALNLSGLCGLTGAGNALRLVPKIVEHLETAISLDETFDQAGPHRALGRIRCKAPKWPLSEGDPTGAVQHLRRAVNIAPDNSTNHLYLAEALLALGNTEDACMELERAISSTQHAVSPCSLDEDRADAFGLMAGCK